MPKVISESPKTHSDILWHFTGGPKWSRKQQKQLTQKKSLKESYDNFCSVLSSKELRVGVYHEQIKLKVSDRFEHVKKSKKLKKIVNTCRIVKTTKVCCVADIPLTELFHHAKNYGTMAIGFKRSSLVNAGFNPVFYTLDDMAIVKNFYDAQFALESADDSTVSHIENLQAEIDCLTENPQGEIDDYIDLSDASAAAEEGVNLIHDALNELEQAMAFIKTFNRSEFDSIYSEREWRSINNYKFKFDDIEKLILPRKNGYLDDFENNQIKTLPKEDYTYCLGRYSMNPEKTVSSILKLAIQDEPRACRLQIFLVRGSNILFCLPNRRKQLITKSHSNSGIRLILSGHSD